MKTIKKVTIDMGTVLESQLREYCEQNVVRHMRIVRKQKVPKASLDVEKDDAKSSDASDKFGYELWVQLSWKEAEDILITYNSKRPRTWANLDRMTLHIDTEYQFKGSIFLQLYQQGDV